MYLTRRAVAVNSGRKCGQEKGSLRRHGQYGEEGFPVSRIREFVLISKAVGFLFHGCVIEVGEDIEASFICDLQKLLNNLTRLKQDEQITPFLAETLILAFKP